MRNKKTLSWIGTIFFTILGLIYIAPIIIVLLNSFKKKSFINLEPFKLPSAKNFIGLDNYTTALDQYGLLKAVGWTVFITVGSVIVILICTSMCAWAITRVKNKFTNAFLFIMCFLNGCTISDGYVYIVIDRRPSQIKYTLGHHYYLSGIWCRLAVFMFCGFVKSIPIEIEEAAMIDGCNPVRTFFSVVLPIMQPTYISVGILETMWIWNDFLLPYLVLDINKYKTISIAIQYMKGSYGRVDMGAIMRR